MLIENEVNILCNLLSIYRNSYATIFGIVLIDQSTKQYSYKVFTPTYTGNLICGSIGNEHSHIIFDGLNSVRKNERIQLYLKFYTEALMEKSIEITYFRYWNLLETIARSKNYVGMLMYDWENQVIVNKKGHSRKIQDSAVDQVQELLRRFFNSSNMSATNSFSCNLDQGHINEQINIWYRHRNCMVHSGGCFPNNAMYCDRILPKFTKCKMANDEIINKRGIREIFEDEYLRNLREIVHLLILGEINGKQY